jgi:hypothetical protein
MDRRNALKALASVVGATTGMTVTPVTTQDAHGVEVVLIKCKRGAPSLETIERLRASWKAGVTGTALENTKVLVFDDSMDIELIRTK